MATARLIIDQRNGPMNMGVDEALLLTVARSGPTLRLYSWEQPTLSLGYFQSVADRRCHIASGACPLVRRSTGGGAILHDKELTYSFVMPVPLHDKSAQKPLYLAFHETLVATLLDLGIEASVAPEPMLEQGQGEPFLCFERRSAGDVLLSGKKICGSAQRRRREGVLQHGSILLARSERAPELPGIADLCRSKLTSHDIWHHWLPRLEERLGLRFKPGNLGPKEEMAAEQLALDRFGDDAWSSRK